MRGGIFLLDNASADFLFVVQSAIDLFIPLVIVCHLNLLSLICVDRDVEETGVHENVVDEDNVSKRTGNDIDRKHNRPSNQRRIGFGIITISD